MIRLRVRSEHQTLCVTCTHGQVTTIKNGKVINYCHSIGQSIPGPVMECTGYEQDGKTSYDYEKMGWVLEVKKGKMMGFISPQEAKKKGVDYERDW